MKKIIAIVGMSGTGKSEATLFLKEKYNLELFYFGGFILDEVKKNNLEINSENEKKIREELRVKHGKGVLAEFASEKIVNADSSVILDGLYSFTEYKILKERFPENFYLIAIHSDKNIRYERLAKREYRPLNQVEVDRRDFAEIENIEKGGPIAIADFHVLNNEDLDTLKNGLLKATEYIFSDKGQ